MPHVALSAALLVLIAACVSPPPEPARPDGASSGQPGPPARAEGLVAQPGSQSAAVAAPRPASAPTSARAAAGIRADEILPIIPRDAIPSIDRPQLLTAEEASKQYADDEPVIAVDLNGDRRAYSVRLLATHEIVNDVVGGTPAAVTF